MQISLWSVPAVSALFVAVGLAAFACVGATSWFFHRQADEATGSDAYDMFKLVGQVTALFTVFMLVQSMSYFRDAEVATAKEASDLQQLDRSLASAGGPAAAMARTRLHEYLESVTGAEWPAMRRAATSSETDRAAVRLQGAVSAVLADVPAAAVLHNVQKNADDVEDARNIRLGAAVSGIPHALWYTAAGLFVLLTATAALMDPRAPQFRIAAVYVAALCLLLSLLFMLDGPYQGGFSVGPEPLRRAQVGIGLRP